MSRTGVKHLTPAASAARHEMVEPPSTFSIPPAFASLLTRELRRQGAGAAWAARLLSRIRRVIVRPSTRRDGGYSNRLQSMTDGIRLSPPPREPAPPASTIIGDSPAGAANREGQPHDNEEEVDLVWFDFSNLGCTDAVVRGVCETLLHTPAGLLTAEVLAAGRESEDQRCRTPPPPPQQQQERSSSPIDDLLGSSSLSHSPSLTVANSSLRLPVSLGMAPSNSSPPPAPSEAAARAPPRSTGSPSSRDRKRREQWFLMLSHNALTDDCASHLVLLLQTQPDRWVHSPSIFCPASPMAQHEAETAFAPLPIDLGAEKGLSASSQCRAWRGVCDGNHFSQRSIHAIRQALCCLHPWTADVAGADEKMIPSETEGEEQDMPASRGLQAGSLERSEAERACVEGVQSVKSQRELRSHHTNNDAEDADQGGPSIRKVMQNNGVPANTNKKISFTANQESEEKEEGQNKGSRVVRGGDTFVRAGSATTTTSRTKKDLALLGGDEHEGRRGTLGGFGLDLKGGVGSSPAFLERYRKLLSTNHRFSTGSSPNADADAASTETEAETAPVVDDADVIDNQNAAGSLLGSGDTHRPDGPQSPPPAMSKTDLRGRQSNTTQARRQDCDPAIRLRTATKEKDGAVVVEMSEDDAEDETLEEVPSRSREQEQDYTKKNKKDSVNSRHERLEKTESRDDNNEENHTTDDLLVYRYLSPWLKGGVVDLSHSVVHTPHTNNSNSDDRPAANDALLSRGKNRPDDQDGGDYGGRLNVEAAAHWNRVLQHTLDITGTSKTTNNNKEEKDEKEDRSETMNPPYHSTEKGAAAVASTTNTITTVWDVLGGLIRHTQRERSRPPTGEAPLPFPIPTPSPFASSVLSGLALLTVLDLSHNSLTSVPRGALPNTLLRLDLSHNALRSLDGGEWLKPCRMLAVLNLRHNRLGADDSDQCHRDPLASEESSSKRMIPTPTTSSSSLAGAFEYTPHLSHLFLGHNALRHLDGISGPLLLFLHTLDLSYNELSDSNVLRPLSLITSLYHLILRGNPIINSAAAKWRNRSDTSFQGSAFSTSILQDITQLTASSATSSSARVMRATQHPLKAMVRQLCPQLAFLDDIQLLHGLSLASSQDASVVIGPPASTGYTGLLHRQGQAASRGARSSTAAELTEDEDVSEYTTLSSPHSRRGGGGDGEDVQVRTSVAAAESTRGVGGSPAMSIYSTRAHEQARQRAVQKYLVAKQKEVAAAHKRHLLDQLAPGRSSLDAENAGTRPTAPGLKKEGSTAGSKQHLSDIVKAHLAREAKAFEDSIAQVLSPREDAPASAPARAAGPIHPSAMKQTTTTMTTTAAPSSGIEPSHSHKTNLQTRANSHRGAVKQTGDRGERKAAQSVRVGGGEGERRTTVPPGMKSTMRRMEPDDAEPPSPRTRQKWQKGLEEETAAVQHVLRHMLDMLEDQHHHHGPSSASATVPPEQRQRRRLMMMADRRAFVEAVRRKDADGGGFISRRHPRGFSLLAPTCIPERMARFLQTPAAARGARRAGGMKSPEEYRQYWKDKEEEEEQSDPREKKDHERIEADVARLTAAVKACEDAKTCLRCLVELVEMSTEYTNEVSQALLSDTTNKKVGPPANASEKTKREAQRRGHAAEIEREIYERVVVLRKALPRT